MNEKQKRVRKFSDLGFGLVLHWGIYSQFGEGEWVQFTHDMEIEEYNKKIADFRAEGFNPRKIASLARENGAGFIILTARHHDRFSLYDTRGLNEHDAPHSPAGRDLIGEFLEACRNEKILPILYHTTLDWQWRGKTTWELDREEFDQYLDYLHSSVEILCTKYGETGGFVFDGNWSRPDMDWKYDRLYGMLRKLQPHAIIMDNTGLERPGALDRREIDAVTFEQHAVTCGETPFGEDVAAMRWLTLNDHWGWSPNDYNFKSGREILEGLAQSRRFGAVYTLNLGPMPDGSLDLLDLAVLERIGRWMGIYGASVRKSRPPRFPCSGKDFLLEAREARRCYYFCHELGIGGPGDVTAPNKGPSLRRLSGWERSVSALLDGQWRETRVGAEGDRAGNQLHQIPLRPESDRQGCCSRMVGSSVQRRLKTG